MSIIENDMKSIDGKPVKLKIENRKKILKLFRKNNAVMSTQDIANSTNLSKTTISKCILFLLKSNLILEYGKGKSTNKGGKRPDLYTLNKNNKYVISILIAPIYIKCSVFNLGYETDDYKEYGINPNESLETVLKHIISYIKSILQKYKEKDIIAISIGCDGIIDYETSTIKLVTHFPSWGKNIKINEVILSQINIKADISVDNAIRILAYAENIEETKTAMTICSEVWGLAGSFVQNGKIERGLNSLIGEIGHMTLNPFDNAKCSCGSFGCFESCVDIKRVVVDARKTNLKKQIEKLGNIEAINKIFALSNSKDKDAILIMDNIIKWFVIAVRNTILMCDPDTIIIQGVYSHAGEYFINSIRKNALNNFLQSIKKKTKIEYSSITDKNPYLLSSAIQVINNYFDKESLYT